MNWKHLKHFSLLLSLVFTRRLLTSGCFFAVEEGSRQTPERGKEENISRQINQKHSRVDFKSLTRCLQRNYFNNLLKCFIGWMKCVIFLIFSLLVGSLSVWLMTFPMVNEAIASDNFSSNSLRDVEYFFFFVKNWNAPDELCSAIIAIAKAAVCPLELELVENIRINWISPSFKWLISSSHRSSQQYRKLQDYSKSVF